jgi:Putative auto-transporter adhesin, head GIN domain
MKFITPLLILFSALILNSCEFMYPCLEGNGNSTTEERSVTSFTSVRSTSSFDVVVQYSPDTYITVEADENLQQYINAYVQGGDLILETEEGRCLESQNRIQVTVYCSYIESAVLSGSGDIEMFDFTADYFNLVLSGSGDFNAGNLVVAKNLEINLSGSGDISIDGKAAEAKYYLSGSGDLRADMMKTNNCELILSGSGDLYAHAYEYMKIILTGSGNVYYYGDPAEIDSRVSGSGEAIKK